MYNSGNNQQVHVKTITLPINPQSSLNSQHVSTSPNAAANLDNHLASKQDVSQIHIPSFNHVPITPHAAASLEEIQRKERERLDKQRERNTKYRNRVKEYTKLGSLPTDKEKIISLLLLCYPHLEDANRAELENVVNNLIESLRQIH